LGNIRIKPLVIVLVILLRLLAIFPHIQLSQGHFKTGYQSKEATAPLANRTNRE
jgi:hypothetical protein